MSENKNGFRQDKKPTNEEAKKMGVEAYNRVIQIEPFLQDFYNAFQSLNIGFAKVAEKTDVPSILEHEVPLTLLATEAYIRIGHTNYFLNTETDELIKIEPIMSYTKQSHVDTSWIFSVEPPNSKKSKTYTFLKASYPDLQSAIRRLSEQVRSDHGVVEPIPEPETESPKDAPPSGKIEVVKQGSPREKEKA